VFLCPACGHRWSVGGAGSAEAIAQADTAGAPNGSIPCTGPMAMTNAGWKEEVERAVSGAGAPWRVTAAWASQTSGTCSADLVDLRSGKERRISLACDHFTTLAARRAEIVRQLQPVR